MASGKQQQSPLNVIVMAAGKGTRLKSDLPKVLHPLYGTPLIGHVLKSLLPLSPAGTYIIVGHGREQVQSAVEKLGLPLSVEFIVQEPQLGTGHAVQQVKKAVGQKISGSVLIVSGDVPLMQTETFQKLLATHQRQDNDLTLLTAKLENPFGYGRVILSGADSAKSQVLKIVEEKDANPDEKAVNIVNTGFYCLNWESISPFLDRLSSQNAQGEFYLTDVVGLAVAAGLKVGADALGNPGEMTGVNTRHDLSECYRILNQSKQESAMREGVTIIDPSNTHLGPDVSIGADTVVYPGCYFEGEVTIGKNCVIGPQTTLMGPVTIGDKTSVIHAYIKNSKIGDECQIGPFAHIRDGSVLSHHVRIGNFVEVKTTTIDHHTNAAHLAYLGDAILGNDVNMGAGSITANYDPIRDQKHQTVIEDGVKVGCNSVLVAPVKLGERSSVAAGSVITQDVEAWDLAIARPKQSEIKNWVKRTLGIGEQESS